MSPSVLSLQHEKLGARFSSGRVPLYYSSVETEYEAMSTKAGLVDLSYVGRLIVTGKDRASFLNGLLTNDIANLAPWRGVRACLLTTKARVLADMRVYNLDDRLLIDTGEASAERIKSTLDQFVITEDVKIENASEALAHLSLQGPSSTEVISKTFRQEELGQPLSVKMVGPTIVISRDRTGKAGFDLILPRDETESVWQGFLLGGVTPVGVSALEILRLEAAVPKYGVDVDENTLVLEAGFKDALNYSKGCYMGQETVARATHIGRVNRKLVQLKSQTRDIPKQGTSSKIQYDGKEVGTVTSLAYSPGLGGAVGLGYAQRDVASEGTRVDILSEDQRAFPAIVSRVVA